MEIQEVCGNVVVGEPPTGAEASTPIELMCQICRDQIPRLAVDHLFRDFCGARYDSIDVSTAFVGLDLSPLPPLISQLNGVGAELRLVERGGRRLLTRSTTTRPRVWIGSSAARITMCGIGEIGDRITQLFTELAELKETSERQRKEWLMDAAEQSLGRLLAPDLVNSVLVRANSS